MQFSNIFSKLWSSASYRLASFPKGSVEIHSDSFKQYAQARNIQFSSFSDSAFLNERYFPQSLEKKSHLAIQPFDSYLEGIFLDIRNPKFYCSNHHLLDNENRVLYHLHYPFEKLPIARQKLFTIPTYHNGTIAYLSNTAPNHYGHWLRLMLPLLGFYQKFVNLDEIDGFYIGDMQEIPTFIQESFTLLGIPAHKIIHSPCKADRILMIATYWKPQKNGFAYLDALSFDFIRHLFLEKIDLSTNCCYQDKVYIARGNVQWRKVLNEEEVLAVLQSYDFDCRVMDKLSILEQAQIVYHARTIVAPHGSALTNLFFGKPNSKILEIFPFHYDDRTSFTLAYHANMQYYYQYGTELPPQNTAPRYENMVVEIPKLKKALEIILK